MIVLWAIWWISAFIIFWAMLGYPLSLILLNKLFGRDNKKDYGYEPSVTVMIVVHNEAGDIAAKLNNTVALDYPADKLEVIIASDYSTDGTDEIVERFIKEHPEIKMRLYRTVGRGGKTVVQNEAQKLCTTELLVMTDANAMLEKNAVRELAAAFSDPSVAFEIIRESGADKVTARSISKRLNCSTQPVLYYYASVEDIKREAYERADRYHSEFLLNIAPECTNPMLAIGMNYIRFAIEERNLFCFLFQSNEFSGKSMMDLMNSEELLPVFDVLQQELQLPAEAAGSIFSTLFVFVHGYASLYANNTMDYDEAEVESAIEAVFEGAVCVAQCRAEKN